MAASHLAMLDHLVFACADLERGVRRVAELVGIEPAPGGSHPAWGTRNALLGLEGGAYLEVVGPDPSRPAPEQGRGLGVEGAGEGRLVTWAVRVADPEAAVERLRNVGVRLGDVIGGRRRRDDGVMLEWTLTDPGAPRLGGVVPFVIDWGRGPHPSTALADAGLTVGRVERVELRHPDPERVGLALEALGVVGVAVDIDRGPPSVEAVITTAAGAIDLR